MCAKRRKVAKSADHGKRPSTVDFNSFAVELLTTIFEFVHEYSMVPLKDTPGQRASPGIVYRKTQPNKRGSQTVPQNFPLHHVEDRRLPVQFNYYLHDFRLVCKLWRDIIEAMPEFSSRLVIFIGRNATPLARIQTQIHRSADRLLDVAIRFHGKVSREKEMKQARDVMKLLTPIVPRCRTFVFDVEHSSSLPVISRDFRGVAPHLRVLKLECHVDDGQDTPFYGARPKIPEGEEFKCPNLTTLILDGNTFMDACFSSWKNQLKSMYLDTFSIYGLSPPYPDRVDDDDYEGYDTNTFLEHLTSIGFIRHLTLHDVNIDDMFGLDIGFEDLHWDNLTIIGFNQALFTELVSVNYSGTPYCYYHLYGTSLVYNVPPVHHLCLERIPNVGSLHFRHDGSVLDLVDCKGLDDSTLKEIMSDCPNLRRLSVVDCPKVTVNGLKNMIEVRDKLVAASSKDSDMTGTYSLKDILCAEWYDQEVNSARGRNYSYDNRPHQSPYAKIEKLCVTRHSRGPTLSKEDRAWFKRRVRHFSWK